MRRLVASISLAVFGLLPLTGCGDSPPVPAGDGDGRRLEAPTTDGPGVTPAAGMEWIRQKPHISLLLIAGQRGKLKPCGCSEPQLGGIERLATLVELNRRRAEAGFGALSLGWSLQDLGEAQSETKASLYRAALEVMGFDALVLGTSDLRVPALAQPFLDGSAYDLPAPPANVPLARTGPLAQAVDTEPFATFEVRGLTVRALSIVDPEQGPQLGDVAEVVLPPGGALQTLTPRPDDLWIVSTDVTGAGMEGLRDSVRRLGPAVILDLSGAGGVDRAENVRLADGPLVVTIAEWGKEAGILDLEPVSAEAGGGWSASYHVLPLEASLETRPSPLRETVTALIDTYKRRVRERGYLAAFGTYPDDDGFAYVGSTRCAVCHPGIYQEWLTTPHATALGTLEAKAYHWDPECIRCHVVGFERFPDGRWVRVEGGFLDPGRTPHLGGVGCECCHGPGEAHVESPLDRSLWAEDGPNRRHPGKRGCAACHDIENSFGFEEDYEAKFLPRADHRDVPSDRRTVYEER